MSEPTLTPSRDHDGDEVLAEVDNLVPRLYAELRRLAHLQLRGERPNHTLGTTALVHESYLRLIRQSSIDWNDTNHFLALTARTMRRVLIDYARRRNAQKRGGAREHVCFDDSLHGSDDRTTLLLTLDQALEKLSQRDERLAKVVELRFFGGLTEKEIARVLDISPRTVRRDWRKARAWLALSLEELSSQPELP